MDRISDYGVKFKDFEQWCFDMGMAFARMLMQTVLENIDGKILKERDKAVYEVRDMRGVSIKTLMGEVDMKRRLYRETSGDKEYVYLLDRVIGLDTIGKISVGLTRRIAETITESSYRAAAETVSLMTGQKIGHMGVWNVVQAVGEKISKCDEASAKLTKVFAAKGEKVVHVLQEEFDGVWINMQGKDRPKKRKKSEMKISLAYEGVKYTGKDKNGKAAYDMVNPLFMAGFESSSKFYDKKEGQIGAIYNLDEIKVRIVNGDGGTWVQSIAEMCPADKVHLQLDPFHMKRELRRSGLGKEEQKKIKSMLKEQKIDEVLNHIKSLTITIADPKVKEKTEKLFTYFSNNKDYLIPIKERGLELPPPPEGMEYGSYGCRWKERSAILQHYV